MAPTSYGRSVIPLSAPAQPSSTASGGGVRLDRVEDLAAAAAERVSLLVEHLPGLASEASDDAEGPSASGRGQGQGRSGGNAGSGSGSLGVSGPPASGYNRRQKKGGGEEECMSPGLLCYILVFTVLLILYLQCAFSGFYWADWVPKPGGDCIPEDDPANDGVALRDKFTQYQLRSHGIQLFIQYSAYRLSPESFLAIGLVGRSVLAQARERLKECSWVPQGADPSDATRRIKGTVTLLEGTEHHNLDYGVLQVTCTLERPHSSTVDGAGGGTVRLDGLNSVMYDEPPQGQGPRRTAFETEEPPFLYNVTHCSGPMHGKLNPERVVQWTRMHFSIGIDHFLFFDAGAIDKAMRKELLPFTSTGIVEIHDFRIISEYNVFYYGQLLLVNDCIYRARSTSKWLLYLDLDEFLWVGSRWTRFQSLLQQYEGKPYLTHGSLWWDKYQCLAASDPEERWPTERMLWHWPDWYCMDHDKFPDSARCLNYWGHRKLIVDPRRVTHVENHLCIDPPMGGVDFPAEELHHNHFQCQHRLHRCPLTFLRRERQTKGVARAELQGECNTTRSENEAVQWWAHGPEQARFTRAVRETPIHFNEIAQERKWWMDYVLRTRKAPTW